MIRRSPPAKFDAKQSIAMEEPAASIQREPNAKQWNFYDPL